MHIIFRADSSIQIGSGHIMRCITLAEKLRSRKADVSFICRDLHGNLSELIRKKGFYVYLLSKPDSKDNPEQSDSSHSSWLEVGWKQDVQDTVGIVKNNNPDWIIVDHYALDYRWHEVIQPYVKNLMVIDDLADRNLKCDLLLDQTFGREKEDYQGLVGHNVHMLLGSQYALLRPEFTKLRSRAKEKKKKKVMRIHVFLGGMDIYNDTLGVLKVLESVQWQDKQPSIDVIMSGKSPGLNTVKKYVREMHLPVNLLTDVGNMAELMILADLAIGAGGSTSWERCAMLLPSLTKITADNQKTVGKKLEETGAAIIWENQNDLKEKIEKFITDENILETMSSTAGKICDGKGCGRVVDHMFEMLHVRTASFDDMELVFRWANDPVVRRYAINSEPISWKTHQQWYNKKLNEKDCFLYIVEYQEIPIGQVRFDLNDGTILISYSLVDRFRGRGMGCKLLLAAFRRFLNEYKKNGIFVAQVRENNIASNKIFNKIGFRIKHRDKDEKLCLYHMTVYDCRRMLIDLNS